MRKTEQNQKIELHASTKTEPQTAEACWGRGEVRHNCWGGIMLQE